MVSITFHPSILQLFNWAQSIVTDSISKGSNDDCPPPFLKEMDSHFCNKQLIANSFIQLPNANDKINKDYLSIEIIAVVII